MKKNKQKSTIVHERSSINTEQKQSSEECYYHLSTLKVRRGCRFLKHISTEL